MQRERAVDLPRLPRGRTEIVLKGEWSKTESGEPFIIETGCTDNTVVMFSTLDNLRHLSRSKTIYMDGTFKTCPTLFTQMFSVHALVCDHVVPLVYVLLVDKSCKTYFSVFNYIRNAMSLDSLIWHPDCILSDFESGLIEAVRLQFPHAHHQGCHFHYAQAVWRHVQELKLAAPYSNDGEVAKPIQLCLALAFIPAAEVQQTFDAICSQVPVTRSVLLEPFFRYFLATWVNGTFPLSMWNKYGADYRHRTNNVVESWHARLKHRMRNHPNIFVLVKALKHEQSMSEVTLARAANGGSPVARRAKYVNLEKRLLCLHAQHSEGSLTTSDLLQKVRHAVKKFK
jgi:hypothetical protein